MQVNDLEDRILKLEIRLEQVQNHADALQLVLSWILAKHQDDEVLMFLRSQAYELEAANSGKYEEWVDTLDDLDGYVSRWRTQWASDAEQAR